MRCFALELIQEAVAAGGAGILRMPLLMRRLQVDLLDSMMATFRGPSRAADAASPRALPDAVMRMTHLTLTLHIVLKRQYLLQVELFVQVCPCRRSVPHPHTHALHQHA